MKPTYEEVYRALITLRKLCYLAEQCTNCPLNVDDGKKCGLIYMPKDWGINEVKEWKAFG